MIGVIALVSEQSCGLDQRQKRLGLRDIVDLAARQAERQRLPRASTITWIFVVSPPRERPMA